MSLSHTLQRFQRDPVALQRLLWPSVYHYDKQREILDSVVNNFQTYVCAGHELGKDYIAGYVALWFFLTHHPCRIVTTSVKDDHLRVLWGEIGRYIATSKYPLLAKEGGPLIVHHREIRKVVHKRVDSISYLIGMVSEKGEGMAGHHAPHTLLIVDEASGVEDVVMEEARIAWAKRILVVGNPYPTSNFFYKGVEQGDLLDV